MANAYYNKFRVKQIVYFKFIINNLKIEVSLARMRLKTIIFSN